MGSLLLSVFPYALGAALAAPIVAVVTALILAKAARPILGAWVFTAGAFALDAIFAAVLLTVFWGEGSQGSDGSTAAGWIDIVLGVLFLALGAMAVFAKPSPEKEAAKRVRIEKAATAPLKALFATGIVAQIINADALAVFGSGLKEIVIEPVPVWQAVVAVAFMLAIVLLPYYAPAVYFAISRQRATVALGRMSEWLIDHDRAVEIVVGLGFGLAFLLKGIAAL